MSTTTPSPATTTTFTPTWGNVTPIINALGSTVATLVGGFMQKKGDYIIADMVERQTRLNVGHQRVINRVNQGQARANMAKSGFDQPNLDIVIQLALDGEMKITQIKQSGYIVAEQWRNAGQQAAFAGAAKGFAPLAQGFIDAVDNDLFSTKPGPIDTGPVASGGPAVPLTIAEASVLA